MYESGREISIRGVIATILLIILVVCILLWLFPIKKDNKDNNNSNTEVVLSEKFEHNLKVLQNAGRVYYYSATLPKNIGDSVSITLKELVNKKILLELKDKNGKACDSDKSYAKLTKKSKEQYELKTFLTCGKEENYLIYTLDCSDLKSNCKVSSSVSKNTTKTTNNNAETTTNTNNSSNTNNNSNNRSNNYNYNYSNYNSNYTASNQATNYTTATVVNQPKPTYYFRYLFECGKTNYSYSDWSAWTKNYISNADGRVVETKVEYEEERVKTGTRQETVTTYVTETVYETKEEKLTYVNTIPENVDSRSCDVVPRNGYTLYNCVITTKTPVQKSVPKTTTKDVDVYETVRKPVTYYRYKTLINNNQSYQVWVYEDDFTNYRNMGCTYIKFEQLTK